MFLLVCQYGNCCKVIALAGACLRDAWWIGRVWPTLPGVTCT